MVRSVSAITPDPGTNFWIIGFLLLWWYLMTKSIWGGKCFPITSPSLSYHFPITSPSLPFRVPSSNLNLDIFPIGQSNSLPLTLIFLPSSILTWPLPHTLLRLVTLNLTLFSIAQHPQMCPAFCHCPDPAMDDLVVPTTSKDLGFIIISLFLISGPSLEFPCNF